jgi:ribose transport system substrate-binding protein
MGYLAVKTMLAHIGKETIEKVIDTGSKAVDKENRDSAEIKALLTPDLKSYLDE